jgi:helicase MOV-10
MINDLLSDQKITSEEIGVITSYYKQSEKIKLLLRSKGLGAVKVGGVEDFQSQEKRALFVSTVRSSRAFKDQDRKYNLGLLNSPKRFNAAITR